MFNFVFVLFRPLVRLKMEELRSKVIDIHARKSVVVESIWEQELRNEIAKQASGVIEVRFIPSFELKIFYVRFCVRLSLGKESQNGCIRFGSGQTLQKSP